jgi:hypothetical protein
MSVVQNQAPKYKPLILKEVRVAKNRILPHRIYRISTYKYSEGNVESLRGNESTLIFSVGIFEKKLSALKLSSIKPEDFFNWMKRIIRNNAVFDTDKEIVEIEDLAPVFDRGGKTLYETHIKNSQSIKKLENPYRTYTIQNIQYVQEVFIKKEVLQQYYG